MVAQIGQMSEGGAPMPDPMFMFNTMLPYFAVMCLSMFVMFGWQWSVAVGLQNKVPANVKMKVGRFKFTFFFPLLYMVMVFGFMAVFMSNVIKQGSRPEPGVLFLFMGIVFPMHFLAMVCMFHNLFFIAKTYKTVMLQRETSIGDYIGEVFLIWFLPVGIWFVQPNINKFVDMQIEESPADHLLA